MKDKTVRVIHVSLIRKSAFLFLQAMTTFSTVFASHIDFTIARRLDCLIQHLIDYLASTGLLVWEA